MSRVLVVFASHHGQTAKIALVLGEQLRAHGLHVSLRDVASTDPDPSGFDLVAVGAAVQLSKHDARVGAWLTRHAGALAGRRCAFFSVSLSAVSTRPEVLANLDGIVAAFLAEAAFHPQHVVKLAGALRYTRYAWLLRQMMRLISGSQGRPTDTRRNHELTDWAQVERFADELAAELPMTSAYEQVA